MVGWRKGGAPFEDVSVVQCGIEWFCFAGGRRGVEVVEMEVTAGEELAGKEFSKDEVSQS